MDLYDWPWYPIYLFQLFWLAKVVNKCFESSGITWELLNSSIQIKQQFSFLSKIKIKTIVIPVYKTHPVWVISTCTFWLTSTLGGGGGRGMGKITEDDMGGEGGGQFWPNFSWRHLWTLFYYQFFFYNCLLIKEVVLMTLCRKQAYTTLKII